MTKLFALLTLLLCAVIAHGDFRGQIGGRPLEERFTARDSLSFDFVVPGMRTVESHIDVSTVAKNPAAPIARITPYSGEAGVMLYEINLIPQRDASTTRPNGAQDSVVWHSKVMLIAFHNGTADTITEIVKYVAGENYAGVGGWIPMAAFAGVLTPPYYRIDNWWATVPSVLRTNNVKEGSIVVRCVLWADSIQVWVQPYEFQVSATQFFWYRMHYASLPSLTSLPEVNLHVQYSDTAMGIWDFNCFAQSDSARDCAIVYAAIDISDRYTPATNPPWGNKLVADLNFQEACEENNIYLYDLAHPVRVHTLQAELASGAYPTIIVDTPTYDTLQYPTFGDYYYYTERPRTRFSVIPNKPSALWFIQLPNPEPGRKSWWCSSTWNSNSTFDSAGVWRVSANPAGFDVNPDTTLPVGSKAVFCANSYMEWSGLEDFLNSNQYENIVQVPYLSGRKQGIIATYNVPAIDSVSGNNRGHFIGYRAWPQERGSSPLRLRNGFQIRHQKAHVSASTTNLTWRWQSMVAFYHFGNAYNAP